MKTILVVDDFASVRLYHSRFLALKGFNCIEAADGTEALKLLLQHPVDLVLLDLIMPGLSSEAFISQLQALPALQAIPVLAITSEALKEDTRRLERRYGIRTLLKPVLPDELLSQVHHALGLRGAGFASSSN